LHAGRLERDAAGHGTKSCRCSGIGAAYHLQHDCPGKSYAILEGRATMGGTWDLFRYPGIRSDSDMYTLGYTFQPWPGDRALADGSDAGPTRPRRPVVVAAAFEVQVVGELPMRAWDVPADVVVTERRTILTHRR